VSFCRCSNFLVLLATMQRTYLGVSALCMAGIAALGINLGNVLKAPEEGQWAPVAQEYYFDDYVSKGFEFVRVPIRWDKHLSQQAPYAVDPTFLARVLTVAGWGLSRGLDIIINSHHDDWIDDTKGFDVALPRFVALWTQVAAAFAGTPASLRFEVYNEVQHLNITQVNQLQSAIAAVMRAGNPTRTIYIGGLSYMSPYWILQHPDAIVWPTLPSGAKDTNIRLEVHSYDPYAFCLQSPPTASSWGTPADVATLTSLYANMSDWQATHGRNVLMGECGCHVAAPSRPDRLKWYATIGKASSMLRDTLSIWDDDGDWKIYDRVERTWDEGVLQALGLP